MLTNCDLLAIIDPDRYRVADSAKPVVITSPERSRLQSQNLSLCADCPQYRDNVVTGEPTEKPCGQNRTLTICKWRSAAARGENQGELCRWVAVLLSDSGVGVFGNAPER